MLYNRRDEAARPVGQLCEEHRQRQPSTMKQVAIVVVEGAKTNTDRQYETKEMKRSEIN